MAHAHAATPMLSRTHGQTATPTTLGKELANVVAGCERPRRLRGRADPRQDQRRGRQLQRARRGLSRNRLAAFSQRFVESLGLTGTAIHHADRAARLASPSTATPCRIDTIAHRPVPRRLGLRLARLLQAARVAGEVGSSTMPHKVNPIDFENAEGNFGIANALLRFLAEKLPVSRWQRDLTDSTVLRNLGVALAHADVAVQSVSRGLARLEVDRTALAADLARNWELLAEPIQTVMRRYAVPGAYEQLKTLTRGRRIDAEAIARFVDGLPIPDAEKQRLKQLTPASYVGVAARLARDV
jgi:adenylosuccinate lyase